MLSEDAMGRAHARTDGRVGDKFLEMQKLLAGMLGPARIQHPTLLTPSRLSLPSFNIIKGVSSLAGFPPKP